MTARGVALRLMQLMRLMRLMLLMQWGYLLHMSMMKAKKRRRWTQPSRMLVRGREKVSVAAARVSSSSSMTMFGGSSLRMNVRPVTSAMAMTRAMARPMEAGTEPMRIL